MNVNNHNDYKLNDQLNQDLGGGLKMTAITVNKGHVWHILIMVVRKGKVVFRAKCGQLNKAKTTMVKLECYYAHV